MTKYYSVDAVACGRNYGFDAEIAFKAEEYINGEPVLKSSQHLVASGFKTRELALAKANQEAEVARSVITSAMSAYLRQFKVAKP